MAKRHDPAAEFQRQLARIKELAQKGPALAVEEARELHKLVGAAFAHHLLTNGFEAQAVKAVRAKFRDAGRRSAPRAAASSRGPGRPQDGADGNREWRWLLAPDHKFYATEVDATLVEVKYYLQAWSMAGAPPLPADSLQQCFGWLVAHRVEPGVYNDPLQLRPIDLTAFARDRRLVQSGHLHPLDLGGRHVPANTFLMFALSNQIQGNLTIDQLITLMREIVTRHQQAGDVVRAPIAEEQQIPPATPPE